jgi:hypothetical protein
MCWDVVGCGTMTRYSASRGIMYSAPPTSDESEDDSSARAAAEAAADD